MPAYPSMYVQRARACCLLVCAHPCLCRTQLSCRTNVCTGMRALAVQMCDASSCMHGCMQDDRQAQPPWLNPLQSDCDVLSTVFCSFLPMIQ